jgi:hypothetical protein
MPAKVKDAEVASLAEEMLRQLELLRSGGNGAYPPKLRQLATLTGGSPTDELIQKAAGKKLFTDKVVVEKVARKPSLDSPVCFKEDAPAKPPAPKRSRKGGGEKDVTELAERMRLVLEAQRRLGGDAYPPTLRRLAELCEFNASDVRVTKAADHEVLTKTALVAAKENKKPKLDAPVICREDIGTEDVLRALFRFALAPSIGSGRGKTKKESTAFTPSELTKRLIAELQEPLGDSLERGMKRGELPEGVAWIEVNGNPYLFLVENMKPHAARPDRQGVDNAPVLSPASDRPPVASIRPQREFVTAFREAFEQLDRRNGTTNFVKIADLRRALADFGRDEFDSGLRALRLNHEFSLDSHEGLYGALSPEEREAGVREAGSLLIYVSRR